MNDAAKSFGLGEWLRDRCQREQLSLRQAGAKAGLSHATIRDIMNGARVSPATIRKLAGAYGGNGDHQLQALEDKLLILAGHRSERPEADLSEPMAQLLDRLSGFSEARLKILSRFADFLAETEEK